VGKLGHLTHGGGRRDDPARPPFARPRARADVSRSAGRPHVARDASSPLSREREESSGAERSGGTLAGHASLRAAAGIAFARATDAVGYTHVGSVCQ
jgi:hypothetical protein